MFGGLDIIFRQDAALAPEEKPFEPDLADVSITDEWFEASACRNCGALLATPYCGQCGQKTVKRFRLREIGKESWDRLRLFEIKSARTLARLILSPGTVAREYVKGRRTAHINPLTLLIALVALLVLVLATNRYFLIYDFSGQNTDVDRMAQRVMAYANWSFSLGIFAIFLASWGVFRNRLGYNVIEHAVLAIFCQNLILAVIIINLLPTLIWRNTEFILWHKTASQYYMYVIKLLIVATAYKQFFCLKLKADWPRLLLAGGLYVALSWASLRVYAMAILWLVSR